MNQTSIVTRLATMLGIVDTLVSKFCLTLILRGEWEHDTYTAKCASIAVSRLGGKRICQRDRLYLYRTVCHQLGVVCEGVDIYEKSLVGEASCRVTDAMASRLSEEVAKRLCS